ncbi:MAG: sulfite exporter TauE/SafE family protein [Gemmataceae bacterium]
MNDPLAVILLVAVALVASVLSAVTGFGGAAVLLPVLVAVFGVQDAVPILTVAQLLGNASRAWFNRREIAWPVVGWFALGSVPAGVVGGILFATAPIPLLTRLLGGFLLLVVVHRHIRKPGERRMKAWWFAPVGAGGNFLSALVGSVGPLMAPFFLAFGLVKGAYIGTEAMTALVMHVTKLGVYGGTSLLTPNNVTVGVMLGVVLVAGSYLGKRLVDRVSERVFALLIEFVLVGAGVYFLVAG